MCFFSFGTAWYKPTLYFSFGFIFKSKDQLSISENSNGSSTSVFSSTMFQKWPKTLFLRVSTPFFSKTWRDGKFFRVQRAKFLRNHLESSYLYKKVQIYSVTACSQGYGLSFLHHSCCVLISYMSGGTYSLKQILNHKFLGNSSRWFKFNFSLKFLPEICWDEIAKEIFF